MSQHALYHDTFTPRLLPRYAAMAAAELALHLRNRKPPRLAVELEPEQNAQDWLDAMLAGEFWFNGENHRLSSPIDWLKNPSADLEWHIVLHKFYHAPALAAAFQRGGEQRYLDAWQAQTLSWIEQVQPGFIAADVTGRRIQNWLYALHLFLSSPYAERIGPVFLRTLLSSIEQQTAWLVENLHPHRNHRTLELFAILLAGVVLPELAGAAAWRDFAIAELDRNAASDFLDDGVHCELSSHYHCLVLKSFVNAIEIARGNKIALPQPLLANVARARDFAIALTKPDGTIPALGDADVKDFRELIQRANRCLGEAWPAASSISALTSFDRAGYHVMRSPSSSGRPADDFYLIFDCGPLGDGNHGHLDCLSFEAAAFGRSLVVDPGRYTYHEADAPNWRARFRGTAAHNTVQIDGAEQTRYRPGPRRYKICGAAPTARLIVRRTTRRWTYVRGEARSHEYPMVHDRRILAWHGAFWLVVDTLTDAHAHRCDLRLQLSAQAHGHTLIEHTAKGARRIRSPNLDVLMLASDDAVLSIEESAISPRYGIKLAAPRIKFSASGSHLRFISLLVPWSTQPPESEIVLDGEDLIVDFRSTLEREQIRFRIPKIQLDVSP